MDKLTETSLYFPKLQRWHGSMHKFIRDGVTPGHETDIIGTRCVVKGCDGTSHFANPVILAEEYTK